MTQFPMLSRNDCHSFRQNLSSGKNFIRNSNIKVYKIIKAWLKWGICASPVLRRIFSCFPVLALLVAWIDGINEKSKHSPGAVGKISSCFLIVRALTLDLSPLKFPILFFLFFPCPTPNSPLSLFLWFAVYGWMESLEGVGNDRPQSSSKAAPGFLEVPDLMAVAEPQAGKCGHWRFSCLLSRKQRCLVSWVKQDCHPPHHPPILPH